MATKKAAKKPVVKSTERYSKISIIRWEKWHAGRIAKLAAVIEGVLHKKNPVVFTTAQIAHAIATAIYKRKEVKK